MGQAGSDKVPVSPEHLKVGFPGGAFTQGPRSHTPVQGPGSPKETQRLYLEALQLPSRKAIFSSVNVTPRVFRAALVLECAL